MFRELLATSDIDGLDFIQQFPRRRRILRLLTGIGNRLGFQPLVLQITIRMLTRGSALPMQVPVDRLGHSPYCIRCPRRRRIETSATRVKAAAAVTAAGP